MLRQSFALFDLCEFSLLGQIGGNDLALAMTEKDLGADVTRSIAQKLVIYHRRAGGQSQHSALLELEPKSDRIQNALVYAKKNLHAALSVEQLAEAAHLSPRQFSRAFRAETVTPFIFDITSCDLEDHDDLADLSVRLHVAVGFDDFSETKSLIDKGLEST